MASRHNPDRLRAVQRYTVLDAEAQPALDRIVRLAQHSSSAPVATLTLVGAKRVSLLAHIGLTEATASAYRTQAFAPLVVDRNDLVIIPNLTADDRLAGHPLVTESPHLRFYAGVPLTSPKGHVLGALSLLGTTPGTLSDANATMLRDLAALAEHEMAHHVLPHAHATILESISDAFFAVDTQWCFTYLNDRAEQLLNRPREDLLGRNVWDEFPEAVDLEFYTAYHNAIETQESVHFEAYFPPLGTWFQVNAYPFEGGLSVYFDDITEQRELEDTLRRQQAEARLLFDANPLPMWVYDPDTLRFLDVNEAAQRVYGYSETDFQAMTILDIRPKDEINRLYNYLDTDRPDLRSAPGVWTHQRADGSTLKVEITSSTVEFEGCDAVLVTVNDVTGQHEAQQALRERESLITSINENIAEGLYRASTEDGLVYVNDAFVQLFGYESAEEMRSLSDLTVLYADPEERFAFVDQAHNQGYLRNQEIKFRRADGSTFWGLLSASVTHNDDGTVQYRDGSVLNIDARKAAEQKLRRREEYLTVTLNSIGDAVIATDPEGRVTEMNSVAETLTGWPAEDALGRPLPVVFPIHNAHTGAPVESPVDKVLREGQIVGLANHTVLTARDGATYQIADSAAPIRADDDGPLLGVVLVFRNVTAEYKRQAEIEAERRRLKLALRGGDLGLWDWNLDTGYVHYNDRWAEMLGYDPNDIAPTADAFRDRVHPDDRPRVFDAIDAHLAGETDFVDLEIRMRARDGSWRWVLDRGQIVERHSDGSAKRIVGTHLDITERKEREKALHHANVMMEQAQAVAEMGSGVWDLEHSTVHLSPEAQRLLGLDTDTCSIDAFLDLVHPDDRAQLIQGAEQLESGEDAHSEYRLHPKNTDNIRWIRGRSRVTQFNDNGEPTRILGILLDITKQKHTTQALSRQKRLLDTIIDSLPGIFYLFDEKGQFLRWNENFESVTGYSSDELAALDPVDLFEGHDRIHVTKRTEHVLKHGHASTSATLLSKSGTRTPYLFTGSRLHIDGTRCVVGMGIDITSRKQAQAALQEREQRVEAFYDAMSDLTQAETATMLAERVCTLITDTLQYPICAIRYDRNGQLVPVAISPGSEAIMGGARPSYSVNGLGAVVRAYRHQTTIRYSGTNPQHSIQSPGNVRSAVYVPIGTHGTISVASPSPDGVASFDTKLLEILSHNMASILDRIEREADLRAARDEAEEMNRLKSAFLANMSHEIRTPLTSIIGFSEILRDEADDSTERFANLIHTSSQRLMETLKSVLDLSKLEAGAMDLSPKPVQVDAEVQSTVDLFQPRASAQDVTLTTHGVDAKCRAVLDKSALDRVLSNMISNAIKFTPSGGSVDVYLHPTPDAIEIAVADTGVGIDEAFLPDLFEAFTQESTGNTRAFEGSGLGLAITKRLVDLMGGTISVESTKGEGTTFTVRLPRESSARPEGASIA
ncbi:histidine kinase [Longimonas halophila]|uniref:histidine kinase n=1 Tax=Longimonas halophila TaxID=1469170 RepID=A0A2H3P9U0_9BACT|nr:PAS domain S-box protein [Longimonas halophila]PEN08811.1 histidine kinase [Longimonas halophila]